jgi:hypothetical protein
MEINFYKEPIKTTKLSLTYCKNKIKTYNTPITKTILLINLFLIMFSSTYFFILKWISLGILSSIGLGSGVPTGILYVFPYIYNYVQKNHNDNFLSIYLNLLIPISLWSLGSAIGEIPPYFVSKKIINKNARIQELTNSDYKIIKFTKKYMIDFIKNYDAYAVVIFASWPNAFFDMCGITCGILDMNFKKFITSTIIGKVFIKSQLQLLFFIIVFSDYYYNIISNYIYLPKTELNETTSTSTYFVIMWNIFISILFIYFIIDVIIETADKQLKLNNKKKFK